MKKKLLLLVMTLAMLVSCFAGTAFAVSAAEASWSGSNVTIGEGVTGGTLVTNDTGEEQSVTYSETVDFNTGAKVQVAFVQTDYFPLHVVSNEPTAFLNDTDYIKFTALQDGKGVEVKAYAMYANNDGRAIASAKMLAEVTYIDGDTREYVESFETFTNVHATPHTLQIRKEGGFLFVSFDGIAAVPVASKANLDLSAATLSISTKNTEAHRYEIMSVSGANLTSFIYHDEWGTLGATEVTDNADGTTVYNIRDGRMGRYNGAETRVRENLVNVKGYDVTQPIVLEAQYEIVNTMAVWWAIALADNPYGNLDRMVYYLEDEGEHKRGDFKENYGSNNMSKDYGVMFQTVAGMAQPQKENELLSAYTTRAGAGGYSNRANLDTIVIEIGDEGTKWTYNGTVLFESIEPKRSDFEDGKVYPYFHFIGTPANPNKENKVVIKGINAPKLTSDETYNYVVGSQDDVVVGLENYNNTNGELTLYTDGACTQAVDSSLYSYNAESKQLTLKAGVFTGFSAGQNYLYVKNDGGSEEITVLVRDAGATTTPPEVEKDVYYYKKGDTADLEIKVDIHNGEFQRVTGGGMSSSRYTFNAPTDGSTIGTIVISGEKFLSGKDYGDLKFTVYTVDVYGETYTDTFTVSVVDEIPSEGEDPGEDPGENPGNGGETTGCGGTLTAVMLPAAALLLAAAVFMFARKKQ